MISNVEDVCVCPWCLAVCFLLSLVDWVILFSASFVLNGFLGTTMYGEQSFESCILARQIAAFLSLWQQYQCKDEFWMKIFQGRMMVVAFSHTVYYCDNPSVSLMDFEG